MATNDDLQRILRRSKEFTFEGTVLVIRDYYTGQTVKLDLECVTNEMFEDLVYEDEEE